MTRIRRINLSTFFKFPSLDGRGKGRVKRKQVTWFHPHLTSPIKGEERRKCEIDLKLIHMGLKMTRIFCLSQLYRRSLYGIILMVLFCMTAFSEEIELIGINAPDFALQDVEDKDYSLKEMKGNVVILIMGNSKTRKETDKWAEAIQKDYAKDKKPALEQSEEFEGELREGLKIFMIADMRGVPWFIPKGFIKACLRKDKPPATMLLDWDGKTHIAYETQEKKPTVFIISKVGKIAYRIDANYDDKTCKKVKAKIKKSLDEGTPMTSDK